jgi:xanthine dehydrogenase YagT iron-sulfur-binding subunit
MTDHNAGPFTLNRRTFVGASAAVGGIVAAESLLSCSAPPAEAATTVTLTINGAERTVEVDNRTSLLDLLRERVKLPGTKKGCNQGACGACTVLLDGRRVNSCLTLAVMHDGAELTTIEGLADGDRCTRCNRHSSTRTPSSAATAPPARSCPASAASRRNTAARARRSGSG